MNIIKFNFPIIIWDTLNYTHVQTTETTSTHARKAQKHLTS